MRKILALLILILFSCKEKQTPIKVDKINTMAELWDNFSQEILNNKAIDWSKLVQIEGQFGEDYAPLFLNENAKAQLEKTTYDKLIDFDFYGTPVKVFQYEVKERDKTYKHIFYFSETNNQLQIIGYLME